MPRSRGVGFIVAFIGRIWYGIGIGGWDWGLEIGAVVQSYKLNLALWRFIISTTTCFVLWF